MEEASSSLDISEAIETLSGLILVDDDLPKNDGGFYVHFRRQVAGDLPRNRLVPMRQKCHSIQSTGVLRDNHVSSYCTPMQTDTTNAPNDVDMGRYYLDYDSMGLLLLDQKRKRVDPPSTHSVESNMLISSQTATIPKNLPKAGLVVQARLGQ
nr:hypothetical protein Iba_chr07bCG8280 [Ipomoea batatas]